MRRRVLHQPLAATSLLALPRAPACPGARAVPTRRAAPSLRLLALRTAHAVASPCAVLHGLAPGPVSPAASVRLARRSCRRRPRVRRAGLRSRSLPRLPRLPSAAPRILSPPALAQAKAAAFDQLFRWASAAMPRAARTPTAPCTRAASLLIAAATPSRSTVNH